ncbi:MAG TPA: hypothetical protein DIT76_01345 [Spartobacteria bacterium]|nr:hypothetical protein [Spartobacteria bacterium]
MQDSQPIDERKGNEANAEQDQANGSQGKDGRADQFLLALPVGLGRFFGQSVLQTKPDSHIRELEPANHTRNGNH